MQFPGQGKPPVGVIFDSDMGNSIDEALALALLYGLDGKNEARVVSVSVSKSSLKSAAFSEVIGRFYAGAVSGAFGASGRTLPVGMAIDGRSPEETPMLTVPLSKKDDKGVSVYRHGIEKLNDTAEVPALIRNAMTAQYDDNSMVVLAGPATNLAATLALPGVRDLAARKTRYLVMAAGSFPDGPPDAHTRADIAAMRKVVDQWPAPILAAGSELGELTYPAASIEKDFAWSTDHPVVDAYRAYRQMPYDAPVWAMAAVLQAVRPQENYFRLSPAGTFTVTGDGRLRHAPSADGKHRYLILDAAQKERITKTFCEIASAKPVPRASRFRSQQQQQLKKEPEAKKQP